MNEARGFFFIVDTSWNWFYNGLALKVYQGWLSKFAYEGWLIGMDGMRNGYIGQCGEDQHEFIAW